MGACLDYRFFPTTDKKIVTERWESAVKLSQHEDGHSYSGSIGMLGTKIASWRDVKVTVDEAIDWLDEHHEKWKPGVAISIVDGEQKGWLVGGLCSS
jgi:hypothetical protein